MKRLFEQSARTSKELEGQKKTNADYEKEIERNKKDAANLRSDASSIRERMASKHGLSEFAALVEPTSHEEEVQADMELVEL